MRQLRRTMEAVSNRHADVHRRAPVAHGELARADAAEVESVGSAVRVRSGGRIAPERAPAPPPRPVSPQEDHQGCMAEDIPSGPMRTFRREDYPRPPYVIVDMVADKRLLAANGRLQLPPELTSRGWPICIRVYELAPRGYDASDNFVSWPSRLRTGEDALPWNFIPEVSGPSSAINIWEHLDIPRFTRRLPPCSTGQVSSAACAGNPNHNPVRELRKRGLPAILLGDEWDKWSYNVAFPEYADMLTSKQQQTWFARKHHDTGGREGLSDQQLVGLLPALRAAGINNVDLWHMRHRTSSSGFAGPPKASPQVRPCASSNTWRAGAGTTPSIHCGRKRTDS